MFKEKDFSCVIGWALIPALVFFLGLNTFAQEDAAYTAGEKKAVVFSNAGCETEASAPLPQPSIKAEMSDLDSRLHAARLAGDRKVLAELLPQLPSKPAGESAGETLIRTSNSFCGSGELREKIAVLMPTSHISGLAAIFGNDIHVRTSNPDTKEWNQSMVSDSEGNLYVAWQDDLLTKDYIQVYWSSNFGKDWQGYGYISNTGADLKNPSIAVGRGGSDTLLVAYIMDDGVNQPVPEVATFNIPSCSGTVRSVPVWANFPEYRKPEIYTDNHTYDYWYAYLTCEAVYDLANANINITTWRSEDYGATWIDKNVALGDFDTFTWIDPDGDFGSAGNDAFLTCYRDDNDSLYCMVSLDYGINWEIPVLVNTLSAEPTKPVDPEIGVAKDYDHVMICCTHSYDGHDVVGQIYSTDKGATWSSLWNLNGTSSMTCFSPALTANEGGNGWHVTFTSDHSIWYSYRPQDLSTYWQATPNVVDDAAYASHTYTKKDIASNWITDMAGMAWADYRDGTGDYDTYFDFTGNDHLYYVPEEYATIQAAINAASDGENVVVSTGTYEENIDFLGKAITVASRKSMALPVIDGMQTGSALSVE